MAARKKYNVDYPVMYAEGKSDNVRAMHRRSTVHYSVHVFQARMFNCVQRGHANALENYPQFLAMSLIAGLGYPVRSLFHACRSVVWLLINLLCSWPLPLLARCGLLDAGSTWSDTHLEVSKRCWQVFIRLTEDVQSPRSATDPVPRPGLQDSSFCCSATSLSRCKSSVLSRLLKH